MPPNLRTFGATTFGDQQRARLAAWILESGWPREQMNIATLEGYLVGLIAWPVSVPSGAWLPPTWGERGWKVPIKIAAPAQYQEFVGLIVGFMRDLDRRLSVQPSRFESSVLQGLHLRAREDALRAWGKGFMTALTLDTQGLKWRSAGTGAAVRTIAANTTGSASFGPNVVEEIASAIFALMEQRSSRGPLGSLETPTSL